MASSDIITEEFDERNPRDIANRLIDAINKVHEAVYADTTIVRSVNPTLDSALTRLSFFGGMASGYLVKVARLIEDIPEIKVSSEEGT